MYFPYLRGRQYELIALRELISLDKLSKNIIPIIEPVKVVPTMASTLDVLNSNKHNFIIIRTPSVGSFVMDGKKEKNITNFEKIQSAINSDYALCGVIMNERGVDFVDKLSQKGVGYERMVAFCFESDNIDTLQKAFGASMPKYNVIPYSPSFRRVRKGERIMIDDKFNKLTRNNDYSKNDDEFFSDDHLYCYDDGYAGFSDYSIVGKDFSESGFAPYAVAIHIVYLDNDNALRVHHFVSDSNEDISDPANKFYEALTKLVKWNKKMKLTTQAMQLFEKMYDEQTYSGLGVVKKLSIMHHLELMGDYLDGVLK